MLLLHARLLALPSIAHVQPVSCFCSCVPNIIRIYAAASYLVAAVLHEVFFEMPLARDPARHTMSSCLVAAVLHDVFVSDLALGVEDKTLHVVLQHTDSLA
jgi:hypothetical protein